MRLVRALRPTRTHNMHPGRSPPRRKFARERRRTSGGAAMRTGRSSATSDCSQAPKDSAESPPRCSSRHCSRRSSASVASMGTINCCSRARRPCLPSSKEDSHATAQANRKA
eukprot:3412137-Alexandrium_andersonii.AAC.1